jgi:hypothetical protein
MVTAIKTAGFDLAGEPAGTEIVMATILGTILGIEGAAVGGLFA